MHHKKLFTILFCTLIIMSWMIPPMTAQEPSMKPPRKMPPPPPTMPRLQEHQTAAERSSRQSDDEALHIIQEVKNENGSLSSSNLATNGDILTYTIRIKNVSPSTISDVEVFNVIPRNSLDRNNLTCLTSSPNGMVSDCHIEIDEIQGTNDVIKLPREIVWELTSPLAPNAEIILSFQGELICQSDGNVIENGVFINYTFDNGRFVNQSNLMQKTVIAGESAVGQFKMTGPTWCSFGGEVGLDLDWGDFDEDGDLDLALATIYGAIVYQNNDGKLEEYWNNKQYTLGVQWVEAIIGNGSLELVTVGNAESTSPFQGINYVYKVSGSGFTEVGDSSISFDDFRRSDAGLWRIATADYDGDGDMDLATMRQTGSSNACLIRLYENDGSGQFFNDGCFANVNPAFNYADSMSWVDYDNDSDPDLAVTFSYYDEVTFDEIGYLYVLINQNGRLTQSQVVAQGIASTLYNLNWGDYDKNGWFDVAIPVYASNELWVYANQGTSGTTPTFADPIVITSKEMSQPTMLDWADMNQDTVLDLVVASDDGHMWVFQPNSDYQSFNLLSKNNSGQKNSTFWTVRSADVDGDGDLEVAIANEAQSIMFLNFGRGLSTVPSSYISTPPNCQARSCYAASSLAFGDIDGDFYVDALIGSTLESGALDTKIHRNKGNGQFDWQPKVEFAGLGPRNVAFGDVDNDYLLDMAIVDGDRALIYLASDTLNPVAELSNNHNSSVAWGDANDDGQLELLLGRVDDGNELYEFDADNNLNLIWSNENGYITTKVAWGDFNRDRYLDFAVATLNGPTQVYCNNQWGSFNMVWQSANVYSSTSIAWADFDGDGDLDLAEGNTNTNNRVYESQLCDTNSCNTTQPFDINTINCGDSITFEELSLSDFPKSSTSPILPVKVAWGDMDNDGDMDLAVGNYGWPDFIYTVSQNKKGETFFDVNWVSSNSYETTDITWADYDNDGDMDLAVTGQDEANFVYANNYVSRQTSLSNNPPYLYIPRPGNTRNGYKYSVGNELLSGVSDPTVPIRYWVYDPDGGGIQNSIFEYSLNDGGTWFTATPATTPTTIITPSQLGQELTFQWDAQTDKAISDNVRFRITVQSHVGRVSWDDTSTHQHGHPQFGSVRAISPPFRVRGLTCVWPENPTFSWRYGNNSLGQSTVPLDTSVEFVGRVDLASQGLTFQWDFSDGNSYTGQVIRRTFNHDDKYYLTLTVTSESCPVAKIVRHQGWLTAGTGIPDNYVPLLSKSRYLGTTSATTRKTLTATTTAPLSSDLPQIATLHGETIADVTTLTWSSPPTESSLTGYRVYRASLAEGQFLPIATLPLDSTTFTDTEMSCEQSYYVTLYNEATESNASMMSYVSPPCKP